MSCGDANTCLQTNIQINTDHTNITNKETNRKIIHTHRLTVRQNSITRKTIETSNIDKPSLGQTVYRKDILSF